MTSTTVAERDTSKTATKAEPKATKVVPPLYFNPGKPAREASSEGERKREAQDAVPPTMEGGNATLINTFLADRFLWLVEGVEHNGIHTVWGAVYDVSIDGAPTEPEDAERRATHIGQGRNLAEAKRAIMTAMVAADPKLQARFRKPPAVRVTVPETTPEPEPEAPAKKAAAKRTSRKKAEPKPETVQVTEADAPKDETTPASS
jgi:hypothetical protein